jgi:hypothetical protein
MREYAKKRGWLIAQPIKEIGSGVMATLASVMAGILINLCRSVQKCAEVCGSVRKCAMVNKNSD